MYCRNTAYQNRAQLRPPVPEQCRENQRHRIREVVQSSCIKEPTNRSWRKTPKEILLHFSRYFKNCFAFQIASELLNTLVKLCIFFKFGEKKSNHDKPVSQGCYSHRIPFPRDTARSFSETFLFSLKLPVSNTSERGRKKSRQEMTGVVCWPWLLGPTPVCHNCVNLVSAATKSAL